jgi:AmiR/NasT family two-component response regulator
MSDPYGDSLYNDQVAQASGMISVQAQCTAAEAFVRIERRAQWTTWSIAEIADAVITRRIRFAPQT